MFAKEEKKVTKCSSNIRLTSCVNHVIHHNSHFTLNITNQIHDLRDNIEVYEGKGFNLESKRANMLVCSLNYSTHKTMKQKQKCKWAQGLEALPSYGFKRMEHGGRLPNDMPTLF